MSNKSSRKLKPKQKTPRALAEIQSEYNQLLAESGALQYQISVFKDELDAINDAMFAVNKEAYERKQLDAAAEKANVKEEAK